jgi:hypothetical protein
MLLTRSECDHSRGWIARSGTSADFGELISNETEKWMKVIRAADINAE